MSEQPGVVLALSPLAEREVESQLFDAGAPLSLLASVVEADELDRAIEEHKPEAVLVSPGLPGLTAAHCERLRAQAVRLVGLALDDRDRDDLLGRGVEQILTPDVSREVLLEAVCSPGEEPRSEAAVPVPVKPRSAPAAEQHGNVLAVIGAKGAPGSSECAASVASVADSRWPTVLLEIDALGSSLDVRLDADPNHGSIVGLIRAAQNDEGALGELIERWLIQRDGWPAVLLGASDPQTFGELARPGAIGGAIQALASLYPLVVCDVGYLLTDNQSAAARVHREALVSSDAVLLVLGTGEVQLRDGLRQLDAISALGISSDRLRIAVAGLGSPSHADKTAVKHAIAERLAERQLTVDAWLPWDARALKRSRRTGRPLAAGRKGRYARAITGLLDELFLPAATSRNPTAKRRKRRLQAPEVQQAVDSEEVALPWRT
jgi:Flp pilus assembly CpaE family ATPase